jgi:hypothetical protein
MLNRTFGFLLIIFFSATSVYSQVAKQVKLGKAQSNRSKAPHTKLYNDIFEADSILFDASNNCDSVTFEKYFTSDIEFYHDLGGLSVGVDIQMQEFREMCARGTHIRRELVKGSLEVYPLKNYGAIEIGTHQFFHTNKGEGEKPSGTYKFIHVWQNKNGQWQISRVISYGHGHMRN